MKILITGDYCPRDRVSELIEKDKGVELFAPDVFQKIKESDYSIVNFECAVADANYNPISKCGPNLRCSSKAVKILKEAGFHCVTLANNHFRDYGDEGVNNSIIAFEQNGLDYFGGGHNIDEAGKTFYKEFDGKRIAIINVCEHEFSIASETRGGSAPLDVIDVSRRIIDAKQCSDFVIVIVHGGNEHYQLPSPRMKKTYRYFVEMGADAVVNHHQHCYSGYEIYQGNPIFYGLGNFCFDWKERRSSMWNEGYMVKLFLEDDVKYELIPYVQCDKEPKVILMRDEQRRVFENKIAELNTKIVDDIALNKEYNAFCERRKDTIIIPFTPYITSYARRAAGHHILPCLIPKDKLAGQINFIDCESHRDVLLNVLKKELEE